MKPIIALFTPNITTRSIDTSMDVSKCLTFKLPEHYAKCHLFNECSSNVTSPKECGKPINRHFVTNS